MTLRQGEATQLNLVTGNKWKVENNEGMNVGPLAETGLARGSHHFEKGHEF